MKNIKKNSIFEFESGQITSQLNMGQIVQMAFELKRHTLSEEVKEEVADPMEKEWIKFCKGKLTLIENTWTRELDSSEPRPVHNEEEENNDEEDIAMALNKVKERKAALVARATESKKLAMQLVEEREVEEDSVPEFEDPDFLGNNFWLKPDYQTFSLDDVMAELNGL